MALLTILISFFNEGETFYSADTNKIVIYDLCAFLLSVDVLSSSSFSSFSVSSFVILYYKMMIVMKKS